MLHDNQGVYSAYNLPGASSPYPRDFILDAEGVIKLAKHEYEPGTMITVIESLLGDITSIAETDSPSTPNNHVLLSIFPNPFNPDVIIKINLETAQSVSLSILDIRGRYVQNIIHDTQLTAGDHRLPVSGGFLPSGVYFVLLELDHGRQVSKIVKLR